MTQPQPAPTGYPVPTGAHENLSSTVLVERAIARDEAELSNNGALGARTGKFTGRSPRDKYVVDEPAVHAEIDWGPVNQPLSPNRFERLLGKVQNYLANRETFVFDGFAGADPRYRLPIRVITEYAWHNLFARQLFIRPTAEELENHRPQFTVVAAPGCLADSAADGTRSETFIAVSFARRLVLIGGTEYAGEIKKSIFTVLNYLLPKQNVFPMHCSANAGQSGDVAVFFGLSGTGKTTLSADPARRLIGDDEHAWSDDGVFNFEGGCYAKCIGLREETEPQIWNAIRFGSVLENVVLDPRDRSCRYDDASLTENTRAAYPLEFIPGALAHGTGGHPRTVLFLAADAFGVLPPIARLTPEQAMYHFLSGYTSKLAGTERGVTSPETTFSTCFAAPFLPLRPAVYAKMLGERLARHDARAFLVNTGWTGGPYGTGSRIRLGLTRSMVSAALEGRLDTVPCTPHPIFRVLVPSYCPGVPSELLDPRGTWPDPEAYDRQARLLASRFNENFARFPDAPAAVREAGPRPS